MEVWKEGSWAGMRRRYKLTTQTPAMPYLPSAAFRSMTLALLWDMSSLGFSASGSAIAESGVGDAGTA